MFIIFSIHQIKLRTSVQGEGGGGVKATAYALRTRGEGGVKNRQNFAYALYGWPLRYQYTLPTMIK